MPKPTRRQRAQRAVANAARVTPDYLLILNNAICELRDQSRGERRKHWAALYRRMTAASEVIALCLDAEDQLTRERVPLAPDFVALAK